MKQFEQWSTLSMSNNWFQVLSKGEVNKIKRFFDTNRVKVNPCKNTYRWSSHKGLHVIHTRLNFWKSLFYSESVSGMSRCCLFKNNIKKAFKHWRNFYYFSIFEFDSDIKILLENVISIFSRLQTFVAASNPYSCFK